MQKGTEMAKSKERKQQIDRYQEVTDKIVAMLESGRKPWQNPWDRAGAAIMSRPINAATGKPYSGINHVVLLANDLSMETGDPRWCTYNKAKEKGWQVKAGSKAETIYFYSKIELKSELDEDGNPKSIPMLKAFPVFHASQMDNIPEFKPVAKPHDWSVIEAAEEIIRNSGALVRHGGDRAFYSPTTDHIQMPPKEAFKSVEGYAATKLHELGHWTGHESRLARTFGKSFGDEAYAKEELRAELASAFLASELGVSAELENHKNYIASWLEALKNDKREIFRAARDAQKIADYVLGLHPALKTTLEAEEEVEATPMKMAG
jgi:antirestriction protein ArdC